MNDKTLYAEYETLSGNRVQISVTEYNGNTGLDIREYYRYDGEYLPSRRGVRIPIDKLGLVIDALLAVAKEYPEYACVRRSP